MPRVIVKRPRGWMDKMRRYRILIDGAEVGTLREEEALLHEVDPGAHTVQAQIDWCTSAPLTLDLRAGDRTVVVRNPLRGWRILLARRVLRSRPNEYLTLEIEV